MRTSARVGLRTLAVTDHDTVAAVDLVADACAAAGIEWVPGIEITSMIGDQDVHVLGYFLDHRSTALAAFLDAQVADRRRRVSEMIARLDALGVHIDPDDVFRGEGNWTRGGLGGRCSRVSCCRREGSGRRARPSNATWVWDGRHGCPAARRRPPR